MNYSTFSYTGFYTVTTHTLQTVACLNVRLYSLPSISNFKEKVFASGNSIHINDSSEIIRRILVTCTGVGNIKPIASGFERNELVKTSARTSLFCIIRTLFLLPVCKKVVLKYPPFVFTFFILGGMFCFLCKKRRLKSFFGTFVVTV